MLNMNSPTVQNLMQSGFNPYNNTGYIPQQQPIQQNTFYNPYAQQQPVGNMIDYGQYYYDPMPTSIVNESRGINTNVVQSAAGYNQQRFNNGYNPHMFNGYMNPILMRNQMENDRIRQREEAINQGKIWKILLQGEANQDEEFDLDSTVKYVESLYYNEPYQEDLSIKDRMTIDRNNHLGELEARLDYYRRNNIPVVSNLDMMRQNFCNYFNQIQEVIGDADNCDMVDYFTRVYPELTQQHLLQQAESYSKNLKNRYNSDEFNQLVDKVSGDKSDSYYSKLMETYADSGVKLQTNNGLVITADEMEVKLPERLLKNKQDIYYEQRKKFFNAIFNKEG